MPAPLTLRDMIWLKVCRKVKFELGYEKQKLFLMMDLREIAFANLGYTKENSAERDNAYYSLPSMREYGIKPPEVKVGKSRGIRKANAKEKKIAEESRKKLEAKKAKKLNKAGK